MIPPPPVVTIEDIQSPDGSDNESNYDGMEVNVTGTVVAIDGSGYYLREDVEAWGSIYVFHPNAPNLTMGSVVQVIGTVIEFHGTTEVTMVRSMQVLTTASATPSPIQLDLHRAELEAWEGAWVTLGPVTLTGTPTQQGQWRIEDATGESNLHVMKSFRVGLDLPTTGIDMGKYDDVGLTLSDASYLGTTIAHINGTVWTSFEIRGIAPQDLGSLTSPTVMATVCSMPMMPSRTMQRNTMTSMVMGRATHQTRIGTEMAGAMFENRPAAPSRRIGSIAQLISMVT